MNRIYQGRATKLELLDDAKRDPSVLQTFDSQALTHQDNPLWRHHEIFQDAVNYYLVALGSLLIRQLNCSTKMFWNVHKISVYRCRGDTFKLPD